MKHHICCPQTHAAYICWSQIHDKHTTHFWCAAQLRKHKMLQNVHCLENLLFQWPVRRSIYSLLVLFLTPRLSLCMPGQPKMASNSVVFCPSQTGDPILMVKRGGFVPAKAQKHKLNCTLSQIHIGDFQLSQPLFYHNSVSQKVNAETYQFASDWVLPAVSAKERLSITVGAFLRPLLPTCECTSRYMTALDPPRRCCLRPQAVMQFSLHPCKIAHHIHHHCKCMQNYVKAVIFLGKHRCLYDMHAATASCNTLVCHHSRSFYLSTNC